MAFSSRAGFRYPIEPAPRTVVLVDWFRQGWFRKRGLCRVFPQGWCAEAASFSPAAIAATLEQLLSLAGIVNPPVVTHALIVLARIGEPPLAAADRERLWHSFRVPLFEQIIGARGELLAAECEAHRGSHIEILGLAWGARGIETTPCACGRATPRLVREEPVERVRGVAAYAR